MDRFLKPSIFDTNPDSPTAAKEWNHWHKTFDNFLASITAHQPDRLMTLTNYVNHSVYDLISDCGTYEAAVNTLRNIYVKPKSEIFSRHLLASRKQKPDRLMTLTNYVNHSVYDLISDCGTYEDAVNTLRNIYKNEIFSRHLLAKAKTW